MQYNLSRAAQFHILSKIGTGRIRRQTQPESDARGQKTEAIASSALVSVPFRNSLLFRPPDGFVFLEKVAVPPIVNPRDVAVARLRTPAARMKRRIVFDRGVTPVFDAPIERGSQGVGAVPPVHQLRVGDQRRPIRPDGAVVELVVLQISVESPAQPAVEGINAHYPEVARSLALVVSALEDCRNVVEQAFGLLFVGDPEQDGEDRIDRKVVLDEIAVPVVDVVPLFVVPEKRVDRGFGPFVHRAIAAGARGVARSGNAGEALEGASVEEFDVRNVARPVDLVRPVAIVVGPRFDDQVGF